jgi:hypothetical protein
VAVVVLLAVIVVWVVPPVVIALRQAHMHHGSTPTPLAVQKLQVAFVFERLRKGQK